MKDDYRYQIIVKTASKDAPYSHEMSAAIIVKNYFHHDVIFQRPQSLKTPDLIIGNQIWELKSPIGDGKNTIHNTFSTARKQSINIVIDLRRCKMHEEKAFSRIREAYKKRKRKKCRILIIRKDEKIVDISDIL